jgi:asparagine synthase (glutamine-hydrolysing)
VNGFACAVAPSGGAMSPALRSWPAAAISTPGNLAAALGDDGFAAAASTAPDALRPLLARRGALLAAGDVRLDNREEVAGWGGVREDGAPDLDLVLAAYAARGAACLDAILGDFALVIRDGERRTVIAIRDPFGVKPLFVARRGGALLLASRADALATEGDFDEEWIADFLAGNAVSSECTVWAGVEAVAPGEVLAWRDGAISRRRFWSAADFAPMKTADERASVDTFRGLLEDAVRVRMAGDTPVWSQLSGGLDSSSVVSVAQRLAEAGGSAGLAGTVTLVETLGDGDERKYSDAVVRRWGVRNETVIDPWAWQDDGVPPPRTDEPRPHYPFWTRDREMVARVRDAGGRVLLSGQGSDHYLAGNLGFIPDLIAAGQVRTAMRELVRFSVASRQSFWTGLGRHAIHPFLPAWVQRRRARAEDRLPEWIDPAFARRMEMVSRLPSARQLAKPRGGSLFAHQVATELAMLPAFVERGAFQDGIEMRYPFLHRPLVEHSLRLPPSLRIRPGGGKHVLREAMRGILPEEIRTRRGKGGIDARLLWALHHERPRLDALLRDPEIARRGWVRADALRAATEQARQGEVDSLPLLLCSLALETWLAVRGGRWQSAAPSPAAAAA